MCEEHVESIRKDPRHAVAEEDDVGTGRETAQVSGVLELRIALRPGRPLQFRVRVPLHVTKRGFKRCDIPRGDGNVGGGYDHEGGRHQRGNYTHVGPK